MAEEKKNEEFENVSHEGVEDIEIAKEMKEAFLDYSMSVIVQRALPDVRDGMKPVHRRILYAMNSLNMTATVPHRKSARIVGDVIGKYHPHGDTAVYDAMVRMAQDFSYRYPLVDGHGNFGSLDGDGAAAMRYTEARMSKISMEMVADINKNTVDFIPTYDSEGEEPTVLPSRIPNLLLNGSMGIAVGMATNIPPHNLNETVKGIEAVMDNPDITVPELMEHIQGPDFPTGGIILGKKGIRQAYETGRGSISIRSKYRVEPLAQGRKRIVFYEIPFAVNKANLIAKMASLIKDKALNGVTYLNDESNREGVRIVMELKKDAQEDVILNQLFRLTPLQSNFGINMLALENGRPKQLSLKEIITNYIDHQVAVILRKTKFDLQKAKDRAHILEGLRIALDHLDEVIHMIRSSHKDENGLNADLCEAFGFTSIQAKAILAMQLRRLSGLEREKIENEYQEVLATIKDLEDILQNHARVLQIIRNDLDDMVKRFGDARRTEIMHSYVDMEDEDLIPREDIVITLTESGYIKRQPISTYKIQNRGGRGVKSLTLNEEDRVDMMVSMTTHNPILLFTNKGRVYRIKGYSIPNASRTAKGLPIVNIIEMQPGEKVQALLPVPDKEDKASYTSLLFVTKNGLAKRTSVKEFDNINKNGKLAITLKENDELRFVKGTYGQDEIIIAGNNGKAVRFDEDQIRLTGRNSAGVQGFNPDGGEVIGVALSHEGDTVLCVSANGYGKRTYFHDFRKTSRGKKGVRALPITEKTGDLVSLLSVNGDEDALIVSSTGIMIRLHLAKIGIYGRNAQGIRLINLAPNSWVTRVTLVHHDEEVVEEVDVVDDSGLVEKIAVEENFEDEFQTEVEEVE